jgi:trigger factor
MTDETKQETTSTEADSQATAVETPPEEAEKTAQADEGKLHQDVQINDAGPCKKHIRVEISRDDIEKRIDEKLQEMAGEANVAGFRPGKAPRKLFAKRYYKDVADQVKNEVLFVSLQQMAEDHQIAPLSAPNIDPFKIEMPEQGQPLIYEFEVEVRPEFDLPPYKGLKLKKPIHTFTEEEITDQQRRLLSPYGQIVPKTDGKADIGDIVTAELTIKDGERVIRTVEESPFRIEKQFAFKDGVIENFGDALSGAGPGDRREVDIKISQLASDAALRGKTVKGVFDIKDLKTVKLPELTHEFLHNFGVHNQEQFREFIDVFLQRQLEFAQHRALREQITQHIAANANWELPEDLLMRQARRAMSRRVMEMRSNGISEEEIRQRQRMMEQDVLASTALSLKEHFVLQKIAEEEKIDVDDDGINAEIERLAEQEGESPRRLRARLEREDMLDALAAEIIERQVLDLILAEAQYEEVPLKPEDRAPSMTTVDDQAVPGEMQNLGEKEEPQSESTEQE